MSLYGEWSTREGVPVFVYRADQDALDEAEWDPIQAPPTRRHWLAVGNRSLAMQVADLYLANRYTESEETTTPLFRVDESLQAERTERIRALKQRRDNATVQSALSDVETAARGDSNLLPPILAAVESLATLGEISDRLRGVFDTYHESF